MYSLTAFSNLAISLLRYSFSEASDLSLIQAQLGPNPIKCLCETVLMSKQKTLGNRTKLYVYLLRIIKRMDENRIHVTTFLLADLRTRPTRC